ncbi:chromate transporter [Mycoplasma zalophi]|uniref:Chromate transporter n=1 Tax=Mycoplasma zalophi TaxID=191287 RepID=A0ABS6DNW1_9MOLU|nr:chromate transporter [Mycoplasma zalophi]MBU4691223.1 chromate transporter [Mycoplasma zalophi]MBU4692002.1 chromate transporter [Mycoplasma zalophi]
MLVFFVGLGFVFLSAFIVFGGGQVFLPIYKWIFEILINNFNLHMQIDQIDQVFAVANATPGIIGTKLAFFTGYLLSYDQSGQAQWWGWLAMFLTYLAICIPAIFFMFFTMKIFTKNQTNTYFIAFNKYLKPCLAAIMISLALQLILSMAIPYLTFNGSSQYISTNYESLKSQIFSGWRKYVLYFWVPFCVILTIYLQKKQIPLLYLILGSIILGFIIFEPWLL